MTELPDLELVEPIHSAQVFQHRIDCFKGMGFTLVESEDLANTWIDTHMVRRMLAQGCGTGLALKILL